MILYYPKNVFQLINNKQTVHIYEGSVRKYIPTNVAKKARKRNLPNQTKINIIQSRNLTVCYILGVLLLI